MDDIAEINYKFHNHDIENIWHIFFCLSDTTFSSIELSYGKSGAYVLSCETMMSICKTLETIDFCCYRNLFRCIYFNPENQRRLDAVFICVECYTE